MKKTKASLKEPQVEVIPEKTKKKKKSKEPEVEKIPERTDWSNHERSARELKTMKRRDIQTACVIRGLSFENVSGFDQLQIIAWFQNNYERPQDHSLIVEYDAWVDKVLENRGYEKGKAIRHPIFNLGITGNLSGTETGRFDSKKPQVSNTPKHIEPKEKKAPKEKNESLGGLTKGTKKELTYLLTREGKSLEKVTEEVMKAFPEAQPKSIRIWVGRCKKDMKDAK